MRLKSARIVDLEEETNKNKPAIRTKWKRQNENENESKRNETDGTVEQAKIAGRAVWGSGPLTHWAIHRARKLRSYIATGRPVLQRIEISAGDGFYPFKGDKKGWFANHSLPPNFESESSREVSRGRCSRVAETRESDSLWSCRRLEPLGFHWRVGEGWVAVVLSRASTRSRLTSRVSTE